MKKAYTTPEIIFDSFELTANIAAGCAFISSNHDPYICPVLDEELGYTIFTDYTNGCASTPPGGNDSICYHVPTADYSVYTS